MTLVYLSGPIIDSSLRKDEFYKAVIEYLEGTGTSVFAPQFLDPIKPDEIYRRDIAEVRASDLVIAEVSNPSLGVGMEIMLAIELKHPVLLFRHEGAPILSKMVTGAEGTALFQYSSIEDVIGILKGISLNALVLSKCPNCGSHISEKAKANTKCVVCHEHYPLQ